MGQPRAAHVPRDTVLVKVTDQGEGPPTADAEADPLRVTC